MAIQRMENVSQNTIVGGKRLGIRGVEETL